MEICLLCDSVSNVTFLESTTDPVSSKTTLVLMQLAEDLHLAPKDMNVDMSGLHLDKPPCTVLFACLAVNTSFNKARILLARLATIYSHRISNSKVWLRAVHAYSTANGQGFCGKADASISVCVHPITFYSFFQRCLFVALTMPLRCMHHASSLH